MKVVTSHIAILLIVSYVTFATQDVKVTVDGDPFVCMRPKADQLPEVCERPTALCEGAAFDNEVVGIENGLKLPAYVYCENVKALVKCFGEIIIPQCETFIDNVRGVLDSVSQRLWFMDENCLCNNTESFSYLCNDPCTAKPCLNGGKCISKKIDQKKEDDSHDYYYDYYYYDSSTKFEFVGCECQPPFTGEFCQICDSNCFGSACNETCKDFATCNCPKGVAGPYCNIDCKDIHHHPENLLRPCIQIARDIYFLTSYQAPIAQLLLMSECLAVSAVHCRIDAIPFLTDLGFWPSFTFADEVLAAGSTTLRGKIPFDLSILENTGN